MTAKTTTRVRMTVDVSLCGSIPRSQMLPSSSSSQHHSSCRCGPPSLPRLSTAKPSLDRSSQEETTTATTITAKGRSPQHGLLSRKEMISLAAQSLQQHGTHFTMASESQQQQEQFQQQPLSGQPLCASPIIDPPTWAVAARGESRLVPVCETADIQSSVDLTSQPTFLIGRSPACDVQLFHDTSSRRHAMLFHHPNGSCYIADCGSVHGTYVNGVRVQSLQPSGKVLPHRVKKGALIRFGGVGAPTFVLKSFLVSFNSLARNVTGETTECQVLEEKPDDCVSRTPTLAPSKATKFLMKPKDGVSLAGLVRFNTRMNAFGGPSALTRSHLTLAKKTLESISNSHNPELQQLIKQSPAILKRSFDQLDNSLVGTPPKKKLRPMITQLNMEDSIMPIVSPTRQKITLFFPDSDLTPNPYTNIPPPPLVQRKTKKVTFSDEKPQAFFPPSVTPDASSDDEDCQIYPAGLDLKDVKLPSLLPPRTPRVCE